MLVGASLIALVQGPREEAKVHRGLAYDALEKKEYGAALDLFDQAQALDPSVPSDAFNLGCLTARFGEIDESIDWLLRAADRGWGKSAQHLTLLLGDTDLVTTRKSDRFAEVLDRTEWNWIRGIDDAYERACQQAEAGRPDRALAWLERAEEAKMGASPHHNDRLRRDPRLESIRSLPRFRRVLDQVSAREAVHRRVLEDSAGARRLDDRGDERVPADGDGENWRRWDLAYSVEFNPTDGNQILTANYDRAVRLIDASTGETLRAIYGHANAVLSAHFSSDGKQIVSAGPDATARVWGQDGRPKAVFPCGGVVQNAAFSNDAQRIVTAGQTEHAARVWATDSDGAPLHILAHDDKVWDADFNHDRSRVVTCSQDGSLRMWDAESGSELWEMRPHNAKGLRTLRTVEFDNSGKSLVVNGYLVASVHDAESGAELARFSSINDNRFQSSSFAPDGSWVVTTSEDGPCFLWNPKNGTLVHSFEGHHGRVLHADISHKLDRVVTSGVDRTIRIWDANTGDALQIFRGEAFPLSSAAISADGQRIRQITPDEAYDWDVVTGSRVSPSGSPRVFEGADGSEAVAWHDPLAHQQSPDSRPIRLPVNLGGGDVYASPDGRRAYTITVRDGTLRGDLWDTTSAELVRTIGNHRRPYSGAPGGRHIPLARFSPDGRLLAVTLLRRNPSKVRQKDPDGEPTTVVVVDASDGSVRATMNGFLKEILSLGFTSDGERLVTGGRDGVTRIWDAKNGTLLRALPQLTREISSVAFAPGGQRVATGSYDTTVRIWDAATGRLEQTLWGHGRPITTVAFGPAGERLVSTALDGRVRLWDVGDGRAIATWARYGSDDWLCHTPSYYYIGTPRAAERARMLLAYRPYPLAHFASTLHRPDEVAEALAGRPAPVARVVAPPDLDVSYPTMPETVVGRRLFLLRAACEDESSGIDRMDMWIDGRKVDADRATQLLVRGSTDHSATVQFPIGFPPGVNVITVALQAVSKDGTLSGRETYSLRYEAPSRDLWVLAVGVAEYDAPGLDLNYPVADVQSIVNCLEAQADGHYSRVHIKTLVDEEVKVESVREARHNFLKQADEDDTIVAFVAGHAIVASGEYYFLTKDHDPAQLDGIDRNDIEKLVTWQDLRARRRILFVDTCHAGARDGMRSADRGVGLFDPATVNDIQQRGMYILAASTANQGAGESDGNGIFTRAIVEGLLGAADIDHDGLVRVEELKVYADQRVKEDSHGQQTPTFPTVEGGENFAITRVTD